ncbi:MAG: response regulator transcription factor [Lachnospiraceae bacterium]|jgi:DNA-binding response OmpR family regulator|nr:response regulator transcription factor [Lachnospiraceae bacterium]
MNALILLVEDNEQILRGNERMLKRRGYDTMIAMTLGEARERLGARRPDAIVLDIMLPDGSGLNFMRELRQTSDIPILLLTGLTTPEDIVRGLESGGDDYLTKPYDFAVLLARIEALLRRAERIPKQLEKGALTLDIRSGRAFLRGEDIALSPKEFAVLLLLAENMGQGLATDYIYETAWKQSADADAGGAVKTVVSRLRRKVGRDFIIENERATDGYILTQSPA